MLTGSYNRGMRQGDWTISDEQGHVISEEYYTLDKRDSTWYTYYINGSVSSEVFYHEGERNGPYITYLQDKTVLFRGNYIQDKKAGCWYYYNPNGSQEHEEFFTMDKPDSIWRWYYPDGKPSYRQTYHLGHLKLEESIDEDGKIHKHSNPMQQPEFPGGKYDFFDYLRAQIHFPKNLLNTDMNLTMVTRFSVDTNGQISDVQILQGINPNYDEQFKRSLEKMPDWVPGLNHNRKIKFNITLPISLINVYSQDEKEVVNKSNQ